MADDAARNPTHIGEALNTVRAAIDVVQHGAARRVIVTGAVGAAILPAARALARAAGVRVEPLRREDDSLEIEVRRAGPGR